MATKRVSKLKWWQRK